MLTSSTALKSFIQKTANVTLKVSSLRCMGTHETHIQAFPVGASFVTIGKVRYYTDKALESTMSFNCETNETARLIALENMARELSVDLTDVIDIAALIS